MSSKEVRAEFAKQIGIWGELPLVQIYDPTAFSPPSVKTGMFVGVQYTASVEQARSLGTPGSNLYREMGSAVVHIVAPNSTPISDILDKAESLRLYFRGKRFDGLKLFDVDPPHLEEGGGLPKLGNWFGAMIAVDYNYDILGE
jgi:hypothetical protein